MEKIAFFDTKPYDKEWFDKLNTDYSIKYIAAKLTTDLSRIHISEPTRRRGI